MDDTHQPETLTARFLSGLTEITRQEWDTLAAATGEPYNPFIAHDFLEALERSGSTGPGTGWQPRHLVVERDDKVIGAVPLYVKAHSQGEYLFDHAFANAWQQAGGQYYPKLLSAVPFTPATGPRLLCQPEDRTSLAAALHQIALESGVSTLAVNFMTEEELAALKRTGFLPRLGEQFHFVDQGFGDFDGFLSSLASRKRKQLRKERAAAVADGIEIDWITGSDITEAHLDRFWMFYQDTGARKWGSPYLTRHAFSLIAERMAENLLFIFARRDSETIAGAMNMIGGDTLYGRYWGCSRHVPFLHFELCYYQALDFAFAHGLKRVEAGAQGEHKLVRGYEPQAVWSAHLFTDPGFHDAVAGYLETERGQMAAEMDYLKDFTPFRRG